MSHSVKLLRSLISSGKVLRRIDGNHDGVVGQNQRFLNSRSRISSNSFGEGAKGQSNSCTTTTTTTTGEGIRRRSSISGRRHFTSLTRVLNSSLKGDGDELDMPGIDSISNQFGREFGSFEKVVPAKVIDSKRVIPDHIEKPDYWKTGHPRVNIGPQSQTVEVKSEEAIEKMRKSCFLAKEVLAAAMAKAKPGVTTQEIDDFVFNYTIELGAYPSPLNYKLFPKSVCTSVNNIACHGIPDSRPLVNGDIVNIDVMVYFDGYHGDCSDTVMVGDVDDKGRKLVEAARTCLYAGISVCAPGVPFNKIGRRIEEVADGLGFTVVPCFTGHGIGQQIHALPDIYHFDYPYPGFMKPGQTFTIEPVITQGMEDIMILDDGWTAVTVDGSRTAQSEHTVLVTKTGVEILTK